MKYQNHPSIIAIRRVNRGFSFHFSHLTVDNVFKEIRNLDSCKANQAADISIKILKENADIFAEYICDFFNESTRKGKFPPILKNANVKPVFLKKVLGDPKKIINLLAFFQSFQTYTKN